MTDQQTIERAVLGKRVVAVAWLPYLASRTIIMVESITLEGGIVLKLRGEDPFIAVLAEIEEGKHADGQLCDDCDEVAAFRTIGNRFLCSEHYDAYCWNLEH